MWWLGRREWRGKEGERRRGVMIDDDDGLMD